jgi:hypothetical protein
MDRGPRGPDCSHRARSSRQVGRSAVKVTTTRLIRQGYGSISRGKCLGALGLTKQARPGFYGLHLFWQKKAPTDCLAENLEPLPLRAYGGSGLPSPSYLVQQDIILLNFCQSVKPPFCLASTRVRISITVSQPRLSTLTTMHGCLYGADCLLFICSPLRAVKTMPAKTTKVVITTKTLNFSNFIPFTPSHVHSVALCRETLCCLGRMGTR